MALGPDGNMWFTMPSENSLLRVSADGTFMTISLPTPNCRPEKIVAGRDKMFFTHTNSPTIGSVSVFDSPAQVIKSRFGISRIDPIEQMCKGSNGSWSRFGGGIDVSDVGQRDLLLLEALDAQDWDNRPILAAGAGRKAVVHEFDRIIGGCRRHKGDRFRSTTLLVIELDPSLTHILDSYPVPQRQ